jgi:hypothetical protein
LTVRVRARSNNGDTLGTELPPLSVQGKLAPPPTPEPEPMPTASASTTADPPADQDQDTPQDNGMDMLIWIGAANLLLLVLGGAAFWLIRRRGTKDPFQLVEETEEPSDPEPTDEAQKEDQA